jgi:hypothetical protein
LTLRVKLVVYKKEALYLIEIHLTFPSLLISSFFWAMDDLLLPVLEMGSWSAPHARCWISQIAKEEQVYLIDEENFKDVLNPRSYR